MKSNNAIEISISLSTGTVVPCIIRLKEDDEGSYFDIQYDTDLTDEEMEEFSYKIERLIEDAVETYMNRFGNAGEA